MNLFTISNNTDEIARSLDDVLLRKTLVEAAQMLSTAIHCNDKIVNKPEGIYKKFNANEEHNVWIRESKYNYKWTLMYLISMLNEYNYRFNKSHDSWKVAKIVALYEDSFPLIPMTPFPRKFSQKSENYDKLMNKDNTFLAYQQYLIDKWDSKKGTNQEPIWTNRQKPMFYSD